MSHPIVRAVTAFAFALALQFATGAAGAAPLADACQTNKAIQVEGADFITGTWHVTGGYDDGGDSVNFDVTFAADGSFVDADNFPGRWMISGSSFTMYYPDETWLGYVGAIQGNAIIGRFQGRDNSGQFEMSRR